jgi:UDP-N-acetylmuramate dehydrogenase
MNVIAKYFTAFNSTEQLNEILLSMNAAVETSLILGGGSNILLTKNIDGLVLKNEIEGIEIVEDNEEHVYLRVGGGMNWHQFVLYCIHHGYAGIENLALIPGSIGASPMQNIGAYGVEIKDVFCSLEAFHINEKKKIIFSKNDCAFGYRESVFKNKYKNQFVITTVTFRLNKKPVYNTSYGAIPQELEKMGVKELSIKSVAQAVMNIRNSKLPNPSVIGNAGSFFKNPEITEAEFTILRSSHPSIVGHAAENNKIKIAAGWLIEQSGWKGFRDGDAGCFDKQALVLVNYGNATGSQIYQLSEKIIQSVQHQFGITLQREVNVL